MKKLNKKLIIGLIVLAILTPVGLILPQYFKAGNAWGEWSTESVKKQTGKVPEGMQKNAGLWKAPIPDYNVGKNKDSLLQRSGYYLISGAIGIGIIFLLSFAAHKLIRKE
jgi:cobalt/nickel transport protein